MTNNEEAGNGNGNTCVFVAKYIAVRKVVIFDNKKTNFVFWMFEFYDARKNPSVSNTKNRNFICKKM